MWQIAFDQPVLADVATKSDLLREGVPRHLVWGRVAGDDYTTIARRGKCPS